MLYFPLRVGRDPSGASIDVLPTLGIYCQNHCLLTLHGRNMRGEGRTPSCGYDPRPTNKYTYQNKILYELNLSFELGCSSDEILYSGASYYHSMFRNFLSLRIGSSCSHVVFEVMRYHVFRILFVKILNFSTAVEQAVACETVTQLARIRYPVGTNFRMSILEDK